MSHPKGLKGAKRFRFDKELSDTLQGRIYKGTDLITNQACVIKEAWIHLVQTGKTRKGHNVPENFVRERKMQMELSNYVDCHISIVKGIESWDDEQCYYIAMEICNEELFEFISHQHSIIYPQFIKEQSLLKQEVMQEPNKWIRLIRNLFTQVVKGVAWMHSKNICHLDLSLENTMMVKNKDGTYQCKIIDFGLCKKFYNNNFKMKGRVGKLQYMCPEAYNGDEYDARSGDIYCLGVMLFMMLIGAPPYKAPSKTNPAFNFIIQGRILDVLKHWKRLRLVTQDALDCLSAIFRPQNKRITMDKLLKLPFIIQDIIDDNEILSVKANMNNNNGNIPNDDIKIADANVSRSMDIERKSSEQMSVDSTTNNQSMKPKGKKLKLKKLARTKLQDWGLLKYEHNLINAGFVALHHFEELSGNNGTKLIDICGFTRQDANHFIKSFQRFKGK